MVLAKFFNFSELPLFPSIVFPLREVVRVGIIDVRHLANSRSSVNGHLRVSLQSSLLLLLLLLSISNSSLPKSVLMDWWLSDIPSVRSTDAGGCRVQAAGSFLPDPLWETLQSPHSTQQPGVRSTITSGKDLNIPSYDAVTTVEPVCQFAILNCWMGCFGIPSTQPATPSLATSIA